ncbi:MAG: 2-oxoacid:acceptor oxidoreductase family protein [archaeon]
MRGSKGKATIKIVGFGGQGVVLASIILGRAAILDGKYSTQTASFGSESRGGECRSEVVISANPIDYPLVDKVETLVAMSQPALAKYIDDLLPGGTLLVDPDMISRLPSRNDITIVKVSATQTAEKLGRRVVANAVMLGALQARTKAVSEKALHEAMKEYVPQRTVELNTKAAQEGRRIIEDTRESSEKSDSLTGAV